MGLNFDREVRKTAGVFYKSSRATATPHDTTPYLARDAAREIVKKYSAVDCLNIMLQADSLRATPKHVSEQITGDLGFSYYSNWSEFLRDVTSTIIEYAVRKIPGVKREERRRIIRVSN